MVGLCPFAENDGRNPVGVGWLGAQFSQGSSRLETLGFGAESLWDSWEFPKGIGSIPDGMG